jgi:hypothetical protein
MEKKIDYRDLAFDTYLPICAYCGFGIRAILEVAHLDQKRSSNDIDNLAILCRNCHLMHDIGLIPTKIIKEMRDTKRDPDWKNRMKDAGKKTATTRKRRTAAKKAVETRKQHSEAEK